MGCESIEESDSDTKPVTITVKPPAASKKWEGEDQDGNELAVKFLLLLLLLLAFSLLSVRLGRIFRGGRRQTNPSSRRSP